MKEKMKRTEFSGAIRFVSISPHGDPEGVVLDNGSFIKMPPHSVKEKGLFKVGAVVSGSGELLTESPNRVFHHAKVEQDKKILADDSMEKPEREGPKEKPKEDKMTRQDAPANQIKMSGKVVAVGTKPKGEVDRMIFDDGTSVHIPKEVELSSKEVKIGDRFEVEGEARLYNKRRFLKAETIRHL